jgi:hypothetical protein
MIPYRAPLLESIPVTSPFGWRGDHMHTGVDFGAPMGTPVWCGDDGFVRYLAYEAGGAGNTVTVEHVDGETRYHHLDSFACTQGQTMWRGDVVGYVGTTGASTGPHLHYEIRLGGEPVDPLPLITYTDDELVEPAPEPEEVDTVYVKFTWGGGRYLSDLMHFRWIADEWDDRAINRFYPAVQEAGEINGLQGFGIPADPVSATLAGLPWPTA